MAIPKRVADRLDLIQNSRLLILEVTKKETGEPAYLLCAAFEAGESDIDIIPLAEMPDVESLTDFYTPPEGAEDRHTDLATASPASDALVDGFLTNHPSGKRTPL
jgi:hypothetical protein